MEGSNSSLPGRAGQRDSIHRQECVPYTRGPVTPNLPSGGCDESGQPCCWEHEMGYA